MRSRENQRFIEFQLAEYQALRAESERISQFLANAVWVGVTGFSLSIVAAGTLSESGLSRSRIAQVTLILLLFQSMAITTMYLSELYKYRRVGVYIRTHIEERCKLYRTNRVPLYWESWIRKKRALILHLSAILFLQTPAIGAAFLLSINPLGPIPFAKTSLFSRIASLLLQDMSARLLLIAIIIANFILVIVLFYYLLFTKWE